MLCPNDMLTQKAVRSVAPLLCRTQELDPTHLEGSGSAFETIYFQVDWIKFGVTTQRAGLSLPLDT